VKPASRPKIRKMPIRSCEATVVRWRWMASEARVEREAPMNLLLLLVLAIPAAA
jgi:hypothetical protein